MTRLRRARTPPPRCALILQSVDYIKPVLSHDPPNLRILPRDLPCHSADEPWYLAPILSERAGQVKQRPGEEDGSGPTSDLNAYRATYREVNGMEAPTPIVEGWTYCDENAGRAEELARKYIGSYW